MVKRQKGRQYIEIGPHEGLWRDSVRAPGHTNRYKRCVLNNLRHSTMCSNINQVRPVGRP